MLSESHPFHSHGTYEVAAASSSLSSGASSGMKLVRATYLLPPALPFSTSSSSLSTGEDRRPSDAPLSMPQEEGNRDAPQLSSSSSEALLLLSQQRSSSRQPSEIGEDAFESDTQEMPIVAGQTEQQQEQQQRVSLAHSSSSSTSSAMVPVSNASSDAATEVIVVSEPSSILVRGNTTTIAATSAAVAGDHPHGRAGPANGSDDRESISSVSAASSSPHRRGSRRQLLPQMQAPNSTQHLLPFSGQYNNSAAQSSFSDNELYAQSTGSLSDRAGGGSDGSRAAPHRQTSSSFTSSPRLAAVAFLSSNEMPLCEDPCLQNSASCRRAPPAVVATGGGTLSPGGNRIAGFSLRSSGYYYGGRGYSNNTNSRPSAFFARDPLNESNGSSGSVAALSPFVASSSLTSVFQTSSAGLPLREAAAAEEWDLPRMLAPPRRWSDSEVVPLPPTLHREGTKRTYRCTVAESPTGSLVGNPASVTAAAAAEGEGEASSGNASMVPPGSQGGAAGPLVLALGDVATLRSRRQKNMDEHRQLLLQQRSGQFSSCATPSAVAIPMADWSTLSHPKNEPHKLSSVDPIAETVVCGVPQSEVKAAVEVSHSSPSPPSTPFGTGVLPLPSSASSTSRLLPPLPSREKDDNVGGGGCGAITETSNRSCIGSCTMTPRGEDDDPLPFLPSSVSPPAPLLFDIFEGNEEDAGDRQRDDEEGEPATARSTTNVIDTGSPSHHSHHQEEEEEEAAAVDEDDVVPVIHFADAALLEDDVPPLRFSIAQPMPSSGGEGGMVGGCRPSHITATRTISGSAVNECSATAETTSCLWDLGLVHCTNPNDAPFALPPHPPVGGPKTPPRPLSGQQLQQQRPPPLQTSTTSCSLFCSRRLELTSSSNYNTPMRERSPSRTPPAYRTVSFASPTAPLPPPPVDKTGFSTSDLSYCSAASLTAVTQIIIKPFPPLPRSSVSTASGSTPTRHTGGGGASAAGLSSVGTFTQSTVYPSFSSGCFQSATTTTTLMGSSPPLHAAHPPSSPQQPLSRASSSTTEGSSLHRHGLRSVAAVPPPSSSVPSLQSLTRQSSAYSSAMGSHPPSPRRTPQTPSYVLKGTTLQPQQPQSQSQFPAPSSAEEEEGDLPLLSDPSAWSTQYAQASLCTILMKVCSGSGKSVDNSSFDRK